MCAKFGCGPTVVSKKKGVYRQTKKTAALYSRLSILVFVFCEYGQRRCEKDVGGMQLSLSMWPSRPHIELPNQ